MSPPRPMYCTQQTGGLHALIPGRIGGSRPPRTLRFPSRPGSAQATARNEGDGSNRANRSHWRTSMAAACREVYPSTQTRRSGDTHPPSIHVDALAYDDFDTSILRLTHARTSRHQQMCVAETLNVDRTLRHAILGEFRGNRLGSTYRQPLVVFRRAGGICVTVDFDPSVLHAGRVVGGILDDLAGTVGQRGLIPVEEDQVGTRWSRCRSGHRRWGGGGGGVTPKL